MATNFYTFKSTNWWVNFIFENILFLGLALFSSHVVHNSDFSLALRDIEAAGITLVFYLFSALCLQIQMWSFHSPKYPNNFAESLEFPITTKHIYTVDVKMPLLVKPPLGRWALQPALVYCTWYLIFLWKNKI